MYVFHSNNSVRVSDNANTLMHYRSVGLDVSDRRSWKGIENVVSEFGMELKKSGEITGTSLIASAASLVARYISAMVKISDMEREAIGVSDEVESFVQEVETYLRLWRPDDELSLTPSVRGHSGRDHSFNFRLGKEFIDATRPHHGKTGAVLRKAADIQNAAAPPPIMVVMDDREETERARIETGILSTLIKVLPFTRLSNNLSGAPLSMH